VFGDLTGYTIVDRIGMTVERYLDSATARQNLVYYVMRRRLGGQVTEPWRLAAQLVSA
jgi:HK97 family phage major capsid protein